MYHISSFPATIHVLQEVLNCSLVAHTSSHLSHAMGHTDISVLFSHVIGALQQDGYELHRIEQQQPYEDHHHLRRMAEEQHPDPNSSAFMLNVGLVLMCVVFAGFASGLTQVCNSMTHIDIILP